MYSNFTHLAHRSINRLVDGPFEGVVRAEMTQLRANDHMEKRVSQYSL